MFSIFSGSRTKLPYLGILSQKSIFFNIFSKNKDVKTPDSLLQPYWQDGFNEKLLIEF